MRIIIILIHFQYNITILLYIKNTKKIYPKRYNKEYIKKGGEFQNNKNYKKITIFLYNFKSFHSIENS